MESGLLINVTLSFENAGVCVRACACSLSMQERGEKNDETEGSENERPSNYMTELASGSL